MTLRIQLDELSTSLCKKAIKEDTPIEASTDALKALTAYYAVREKVKMKAGDGEDGENPADFNQFSGAIHGAGQGAPDARPAKPPSGRRRDS